MPIVIYIRHGEGGNAKSEGGISVGLG